jgi:DNA-binding transcriptional LysR family regulator
MAQRSSWVPLGLDLTTLRLFVATVEEGTLARAAERENIALSAISKRISLLEARSGVQLFERHDRGMRLTPAGDCLFNRLTVVVDGLNQIAVDLESMRNGVRGVVRINADMFAASDGLASRVAGFMANYPDIEVLIEEQPSSAVLHAVKTGVAEIGLVGGRVQATDLQLIPWQESNLVAVLPNDDSLLAQRSLSFASLMERPFILIQKDCCLSELLRSQAHCLGARLNERSHASSFESVRMMVAAGLGVSVLPENSARGLAETGIVVRPLAETWARSVSAFCVRSTMGLPAAARLVIEWLQLTDDAESAAASGRNEPWWPKISRSSISAKMAPLTSATIIDFREVAEANAQRSRWSVAAE